MIKMSQYGDLVKLPSYLKPPENLTEPNAEATDEQETASQSAQASSDDNKVSRGTIGDAFDKAKEIIEAAEAYKVNTIKEATEKMNEECSRMKIKSREEGFALGKLEGKKQGEEEGYKLGYKDGLDKAEKENQLIVNELERLISDVQDAKELIVKKYEDDLQNLAVAIAKKIVNAELKVNDDVISNIIKGAVADYHNQEWLTITVSKGTAERIEKFDKDIIKDLKSVSGNVKIVPSAQANDGDCFIDLPDAAIDASIDSQFANIENSIN